MNLQYQAIGYVQSPYKQKFAIPRQPNIVPEVSGEIVLSGEFADPNVLRHIDQFSHLWLLFHFHETAGQGWSPTVQPPRLGGKERVGVFASRSPFRPNSVGMSAVKNLGHVSHRGKLIITVGGLDLLDGTPIIDIKPYLPYADCLTDANGGYAERTPASELSVVYCRDAQRQLADLQTRYPQLQNIITSVLKQDPRPAWRVKENDDKQYGITLYDLNIKWRVDEKNIVVSSISALSRA